MFKKHLLIIILYQGSDASEKDRTTAFDKAYELENEIEGNVALVKVPQGKEPKHFLSIFKGEMMIFKPSSFLSVFK